MEINKIAVDIQPVMYLSFIPVIVNFVILMANPDEAQKIGRALVWHLASLVALPLTAGIILKYASKWTQANDYIIIFILEAAAAMALAAFAIRSAFKKSKPEAYAFATASFSVLLWGLALLKILAK